MLLDIKEMQNKIQKWIFFFYWIGKDLKMAAQPLPIV